MVDVGSFLIAAILLCWLPNEHHTNPKPAGVFAELRVGFTYTLKKQVILSGSLMFFFTNFALNMFEANYMYYMIKQLGYSLFKTSIAMTIAGIGALLGGLFATKWLSRCCFDEQYHVGWWVDLSIIACASIYILV